MRIAIIGDLHLGYRQYGLDERENDFYQRWSQIIDNVIDKNIDVVLQLGDIFDTHIPSAIALYEYNKGLMRLKQNNIQYYSITGNHTIIKKRNFMSPDDFCAKLSQSSSLDDTYITIGDNIIAGVKYRAESNKKELLDIINQQVHIAEKYSGLKILLLHQAIDVDLFYGAELQEDDLPFDVFDYIFIGHLHSRIDRVHGNCRIVYPGSIERSSKTEAIDALNRGKGFYILDFDTNKCEFINILLKRDFLFFDVKAEQDIYDIQDKITSLKYQPIVELTFSEQFDVEQAQEIATIIADDCLKLNTVVLNDEEVGQDDEILTQQSILSIQDMLQKSMTKQEAVFVYDLLQIFNKNAKNSDNIVSAIELCDEYFNNNY